MTLLQQARLLDSAISDLNVMAAAQLLGLWTGAGGNLSQVFTGFQPLIKPLLTAGAMVTAAWYNRQAHSGRYVAEPLYDIPDERIDANVHWALFSPGEAHLERLAGTTERMVRDSSRQTVVANVGRERGARWVRFANAGCCEFCAVLATRGPVYTSEANALASHDWCKCGAIVVRPGGIPWEAPDYYDVFEAEYAAARTGIEKGDSLATELGIAGEVPSLGGERSAPENLVRYMRARREGRVPEVTAPQLKKPKKELSAVDAITNDWNRRRPNFQATPTKAGPGVKGYPTVWGKDEYPGVVRDYLDGIGYMLDKYPQIEELAAAKGQTLSTGSIYEPTIAAWMRTDLINNELRIEYNRGQMPSIGGRRTYTQYHEFDLPDGTKAMKHMPFLAGGGGPYTNHRSTSHHEMGHMMDALTGWRASNNVVTQKLLPAFLEDYAVKSPMEGIDAAKATPKQIKAYGEFLNKRDSDFQRWLYDTQSRYSFITADNASTYGKKVGQINPVELLAEAVVDVEAFGDKASRPSQLIHEYLMEQVDVELKRFRKYAA